MARLDRAGQPVSEEGGECRRVLWRSTFSEKCCSVQQLGGFDEGVICAPVQMGVA